MTDCPDSAHGHELDYHNLYGEPDDPLRLRQRADCIHCGERFWVVYERSHIESCENDERGYPLASELHDDGTLSAPITK